MTNIIKGVLPYDGDGSNGRPLTLFQLTDDTILPTYSKGVAAAIKALAYGSDDRNVFTWDEAEYFMLGPVVKRYPNSFKKGGSFPNVSAVLSVLAKPQPDGTKLVRRVSDKTYHAVLDVDEGLIILSDIINWMARPMYRDGKEAYRTKRYQIPHWLLSWDESRPNLPRKIAPYLHELRRKVWRSRGKRDILAGI